jgi:O-antigen/teichoic acid export membrane protein
MIVLVWAQLFNAAFGPVGLLLAMSGHERATVASYVTSLVITATSGYLLIPHMQAVGGALAVAAGICVVNAVTGFAVFKKLGIRPGIF